MFGNIELSGLYYWNGYGRYRYGFWNLDMGIVVVFREIIFYGIIKIFNGRYKGYE